MSMDLMGLLVNKESGCAVVGGVRGSMWRRSGRITLVNGLCANDMNEKVTNGSDLDIR